MTTFLFLCLAGVAAWALYLFTKISAYRKKIEEMEIFAQELKAKNLSDIYKYDEELRKKADLVTILETENKGLSKWKTIEDADKHANIILQDAKDKLDNANIQANEIFINAKKQADDLITEARIKAKNLKESADMSINDATKKAADILASANQRAKEIAGSAYEAMQKATQFEKTIQAMKNIIDGYGDRYLIPGHSLVDDLADDFGHTEAGKNLKLARDRSKIMIDNGTAATCDYVETNRKDTAIRFVIDAFNGKVDSILSRVRSDNAGKLEQEIRDAYVLVNHNGKAFRNAVITESYLESRLEELKWAAVAQQLRIEERDEQRRIKEQLREEEKARREYERAIRDAAKEEEVIKRAMEKAQQQIERASAEQKAKYEQQLEELLQKLKEAEERSQRALSMAQQTRRGHVYIISNIGSFGDHVYKIGLTRRLEPLDRVRELGDSSVPFSFDVHAMIFNDDAPALENSLHKHFVINQMNKVNHRKEFFRVDLTHIREEIEKMGLNVKWTMTAEAMEYRESLAIEKAIQENPTLREDWINRQLRLEAVDNEVNVLEEESVE